MKPFGVYTRISTDRQDFESQRHAIQAWLGARPALFFQDIESGKKDSRPGYQALMAAARAGEISDVVVFRLDRFHRDARLGFQALLDLDTLGVGFIPVDQPSLNMASDFPFRRVILAVFAEIAQIEREQIVSRVNAGIAAAKARGVHCGRPQKVTAAHVAKVKALVEGGYGRHRAAAEAGISIAVTHLIMQGRYRADGKFLGRKIPKRKAKL